VTLPSRQELNASFVAASYHVESVPLQIGTLATTLPLVLSIITMNLPARQQSMGRRSSAMPVGASPGATDQVAMTFLAEASITSIASLSSMFTYTRPAAESAWPVSAVPDSGIVAITLPVASICVADFPVWLKIQTSFSSDQSNSVWIGAAAVHLLRVCRVFASTMLTLFSRPLLVNRRPDPMATPWIPGVSLIRPTTLSVPVSMTTTSAFPCDTYRRLAALSTLR